jgi:hypothetical protein
MFGFVCVWLQTVVAVANGITEKAIDNVCEKTYDTASKAGLRKRLASR